MSQSSWIDDPQAWNTVRLGAITLPGICQVTMSRGREIDFKKAPGKDGGESTDKGANAAKVKIRVTMTARQWRDQWLQILPTIEPAQGKPVGPLTIVHPEPNSRGINTIEIKDISSAPPTAKGGIVYDLDCQQWFPRPKDTKGKAPKGPFVPKLFTKEGTDRNFDETRLLPSGAEALDLALGNSNGRRGITVVEDPVTGEVKRYEP